MKTTILLTNLGTPSSLTVKAVRRYLREFLSDPDVVQIRPRWLWRFVLNSVILPFRSQKSLRRYQQIWTPEGSPLLAYSQKLAEALGADLGPDYQVEIGMRYGAPSIQEALKNLDQAGVDKIIVLPLYPQSSLSTTRTTFSAVTQEISKRANTPSLYFQAHYFSHPAYIQALTESVVSYWAQHGQSDRLIFSFHGIPENFIKQGDLYQSECQETVRLLAQKLNLKEGEYALAFQSRFGKAKWVQPYLEDVLQDCVERGDVKVQILCPGFAVDCLETLEEIAMEAKKLFLQKGGLALEYIPCLNASPGHVRMLKTMVQEGERVIS